MKKIYALLIGVIVGSTAVAQSFDNAPALKVLDKDQITPIIAPRGEIQVGSMLRATDILFEDFQAGGPDLPGRQHRARGGRHAHQGRRQPRPRDHAVGVRRRRRAAGARAGLGNVFLGAGRCALCLWGEGIFPVSAVQFCGRTGLGEAQG